jgi:very-short-patch-repair endonuclease
MSDVGRSDDVEHHHSDPGPVERENRLARLARRQYGVIARDQLLRIGFSPPAIRYRLECGRLHLVHPQVYAVGPQPLVANGRWYAALLATRPDPALSHLSSAAKRGLARERNVVHVTTTIRSGRRLIGVAVHRVRRLHPDDVERIDGLPVTTLPRTLLDLAETEPYHRLEAIAEAADRREPLDLAAIRSCMERNPGRRGLAPLDRLLGDYLPVLDANEGLERQFQRFLAEAGFPQPQTNVLVADQEVDCWWPEHNLVVELDSRRFHAGWQAQERDRARDARLLRAGIPVLRVTHRRLTREPAELIADLASRLPGTESIEHAG